MRKIGNKPMIEILLTRLSKAKNLDQIVLATSTEQQDNFLAAFVKGLGYEVFQGSEKDVLDRYYQAAQSVKADVVVRITGDCPLVDPELVDEVIELFFQEKVDYASNVQPPTYPDGLDVEVFSSASLKTAWLQALQPYEREHVTPFIRNSLEFKATNLISQVNHSSERWTVDEYEDFEIVQKIFAYFSPRLHFSWLEILNLYDNENEMFRANHHLKRNEGAVLSSGQKLWRRAKKVIPGGSMLLSKRAEMFLPEQWPAYFSRALGCKVWDLDGNEYIDMSIMGIGTNTLGFGHPEVDDAVRQVVDKGNMSTFNCPEEVYLAEKLVELHPWSDMVRFARTGGEANAVAIRIARAAVGKEKVAFCGYHGWHDWYLAANLGDSQTLSGHLLPGLDPNGVPSNLKNTIFPFNYNKFDELEALVNDQEIGVIKMEVSRNQGPEPGFLEKVRTLSDKNGIVLIFDECTSGFRQSYGGLHKLYGVEPDMAIFGKALGNGYAITAIIGRREIMEAAQTSFISSTFWTERIGSAAGLKTLEVMEGIQSWDMITRTGLSIRQGWQELAEKYSIPISHWGIPALAGFTINSPSNLQYKTLITQEMLAKGYLAGNCVYSSICHSQEILDRYFEALDPVFSVISECENGRDINELLRGPVCHSGFKRLN